MNKAKVLALAIVSLMTLGVFSQTTLAQSTRTVTINNVPSPLNVMCRQIRIVPIQSVQPTSVVARVSGTGPTTLKLDYAVTVSNGVNWEVGGNLGLNWLLSAGINSSVGFSTSVSRTATMGFDWKLTAGQRGRLEAIAVYRGVRFNVMCQPWIGGEWRMAAGIARDFFELRRNAVRL